MREESQYLEGRFPNAVISNANPSTTTTTTTAMATTTTAQQQQRGQQHGISEEQCAEAARCVTGPSPHSNSNIEYSNMYNMKNVYVYEKNTFLGARRCLITWRARTPLDFYEWRLPETSPMVWDFLDY